MATPSSGFSPEQLAAMGADRSWAQSTVPFYYDAAGNRIATFGFGPGSLNFNLDTGEQYAPTPMSSGIRGEEGSILPTTYDAFGGEEGYRAAAMQMGWPLPAPVQARPGGYEQVWTHDPNPGSTFLEKIWPYATAALGGGAIAGGLGATGTGGLSSLGPVATEGFAGAAPVLGAGAGTFSAPASLAGIASGAGAAGGAGMGFTDFLTNVFSGAQDLFSQAGTGIQNFFSNVFGGNPFGEVGGIPNAGSFGISEGGAFPGWVPDSTGLMIPTSEAAGGGGIGSFLQNIFGNFGTNARANPLSTLANLASTFQAFSSADDVRAAGRDPLGLSRLNAAARLNELTNNPSLITSYPGYQAGLEGVLRGSAAAGYTASGNELAALQKYGGQFYNDEVTRLAQLAGFQFSPVQLTAGQQEAEQQATNLIARALGNLGFMFRSPFPTRA